MSLETAVAEFNAARAEVATVVAERDRLVHAHNHSAAKISAQNIKIQAARVRWQSARQTLQQELQRAEVPGAPAPAPVLTSEVR